MMAFKYLQWNPKVLSLEINSSETNIITAGNNGRDMNVLTLTTDRSNVIRHVYLGIVLFPLPKDMCSTVTRAWKTGHRGPRSSACEYGNFFPPCSAKSWSAHNNVRPHLWSRRKRNNLSKRWRHDWSIYQREFNMQKGWQAVLWTRNRPWKSRGYKVNNYYSWFHVLTKRNKI